MSQLHHLPLALGQEAFHLALVERLGGSAGQGGKRDHPGVGQGLGARQPASRKNTDRRRDAKGCEMSVCTAF